MSKKRKWMIYLAAFLLFAAAGVCEGENQTVQTGSIPVLLQEPTKNSLDSMRILDAEVDLFGYRQTQDNPLNEDTAMIATTMKCITTQMAAWMAQYGELCDISSVLQYVSSEMVDPDVKIQVILPDGTMTEHTTVLQMSYSGIDEVVSAVNSNLGSKIFGQMLEKHGRILPGEYLCEFYVDDTRVARRFFVVLDSSYTLGVAPKSCAIYRSPDCEEEIGTLPDLGNVRILGIEARTGHDNEYAYQVEYEGTEGYVKGYNLVPRCDEEMITIIGNRGMEDVSIRGFYPFVTLGEDDEVTELKAITRGQAEYFADQQDALLVLMTQYGIDRPYIPKGTKAVVRVTDPQGKTRTLSLEDASAKTMKDMAIKVLSLLGGRLMSEYEVEVEVDGEMYAGFTLFINKNTVYPDKVFSRMLDINLHTRVVLPDGSVYEWTSMHQETTADDPSETYYADDALTRMFQDMREKGGIQCGDYALSYYADEQLIYTLGFEVLDNDYVVATVKQETPLFANEACKKELTRIPDGADVHLEQGEIVLTQINYGKTRMDPRWAVPVEYKGKKGYVYCDMLKMKFNDELKQYLWEQDAEKVRRNWMNLTISPVTKHDEYPIGSITDTVITTGLARLAAQNKAYTMFAAVYYTLEEERAAQFRIRITRPDGEVYEKEKKTAPQYDMAGNVLYLDDSICDMFLEMQGYVLPGSYHYEVEETGSGMYKDGWFEVMDFELPLGETTEDARLYADPGKRRVLATVPIYSNIFLYDDAYYDGQSYIAQVSWNGIVGYMDQKDYYPYYKAERQMQRNLGADTVSVQAVCLIYSDGAVDIPIEGTLNAQQFADAVSAAGSGSIRAEIHYTAPEEEQLLQFTFAAEAPDGVQVATSEVYVYVDAEQCGRDSKVIDSGTIVTLFERLAKQGKYDEGIYSYRVYMNGQMLTQNQVNLNLEGLAHDIVLWPEAPAQGQDTECGTVTIRKSGSVNVREQSNADSRRVGTAKSGKEYPCLGIAENGWYRIQLEDGTTGYVSNNMSTLTEK